jgi:hypothetical protein
VVLLAAAVIAVSAFRRAGLALLQVTLAIAALITVGLALGYPTAASFVAAGTWRDRGSTSCTRPAPPRRA